jgi:hypothetical protein
MKLINALLAALLALSLCGNAAQAAEPEEHFLLTPALLQKMKAVGAEMKKYENEETDMSEAKDNLSVDEYAKAIDKEPRAKALLAKHGIRSRDFALGTFALVHAGLFVSMESMMNKKQMAEQMAGFTKEQRANVELLRKLGPSYYRYD